MTNLRAVSRPTTCLGRRYLVLWELPGDDIAEVIVAQDTVLDRLVDIRLLPRHCVGDRDRTARFAAGTQAAAAVAHPGLVTVLDRGEVDGRPFVVCARTVGVTLAQAVGDNGPLSAQRAAWIGATVADALGVAHRGGVVHGAVGADTIIIGPDTTPILVNLGLSARPTQGPAEDITALAATVLRVLGPDPHDTPLRWMLRLAGETSPKEDRFVWDAAGLARQLRQLGGDHSIHPADVDSPATTKIIARLPEATIELPVTPPADPTRVLDVPTDTPAPAVASRSMRRRLKRAVMLTAAVTAVVLIVVALGYQAIATGGGPISVTNPSAATTSTTVAAASPNDQTTTGVASDSGYPPGADPGAEGPAPRAAPPAPTQPASPAAPKPPGPARAPSVAGNGPAVP